MLYPTISFSIGSIWSGSIPVTGRMARPFSSCTPTTIYPPPVSSKSLAKAQMVRYMASGFHPVLYSIRLPSTACPLSSSSIFTGSILSLISLLLSRFYISLQKYIIPKFPRNLLLNIWAGSKAASRACALRKFFPEKLFNPSLLALFVCM